MRKVIWFNNVKVPAEKVGQYGWELKEQGEATFHQFGSNYEEFENGAGNFSTAIIELPDGTIKNIPVEHIKFIKAAKGE